jgi:hypothetical protein
MTSFSSLLFLLTVWFIRERRGLRNVLWKWKMNILSRVPASCPAECICNTSSPVRPFVVLFLFCSSWFQGHLCARLGPGKGLHLNVCRVSRTALTKKIAWETNLGVAYFQTLFTTQQGTCSAEQCSSNDTQLKAFGCATNFDNKFYLVI